MSKGKQVFIPVDYVAVLYRYKIIIPTNLIL